MGFVRMGGSSVDNWGGGLNSVRVGKGSRGVAQREVLGLNRGGGVVLGLGHGMGLLGGGHLGGVND